MANWISRLKQRMQDAAIIRMGGVTFASYRGYCDQLHRIIEQSGGAVVLHQWDTLHGEHLEKPVLVTGDDVRVSGCDFTNGGKVILSPMVRNASVVSCSFRGNAALAETEAA